MPAVHPLLDPIVRSAIERETSAHLGRPWRQVGFVDLDDRASHPCGVLVGTGFRVFAKFSNAVDARVQTFEAANLFVSAVRDRFKDHRWE